MKIYALRHGLTELNRKETINGKIDEPLVKEGVKQAEDAIRLVPESVKYIYSSPLIRAKQTANIISSKLNNLVLINNGIREINFGSLEGKTWNEIELKFGEELRHKHKQVVYNYHEYGGESAEDVKNRVLLFLKEIKNKHNDGEVLLLTHGGIIRMLHLLEYGTSLIEINNISLHCFDLDKIVK